MNFTCQELLCVTRQVSKDGGKKAIVEAIKDALECMDDERESYVVWESVAMEDEDSEIEISHYASDEDGPDENTYTVIVGYYYEEANYAFPEETTGDLKGKVPGNLSVFDGGLCQSAVDADDNEVFLECIDSSEASPTYVWIYLGDEELERFEVDEVESWEDALDSIVE